MSICGPFDPAFSDLPDVMPVFPLSGALLLPRGHLPLNIFEPRYMNMVADALGQDRIFGMIQPRPDQHKNYFMDPDHPEIFSTGCAGRITAFSETDDGRFLITLTGVCRFNVIEELPCTDGGYRTVRGDFSPWKDDLDIPADDTPINRDRLRIALEAYFAQHSLRSCWDTLADSDDEMLITTISMGCRLSPLEKQALLECTTLYDRGDMLTTLLEMAVHAGPKQVHGSAN
ncbi:MULTISPECIES: LON peptidase substrate-binding domain-containing protein [Thalassospira]|uniref:Peptidase S16 n=1 Tax=Thalassospira povalilytica TaxID=732237 RepID=A0ABX4R8J7_9PROT|nr:MULTISPECIES: LON peptidase substrate-binding domain-containing protein [Thalassospira]RCK27877.1 peptidase S16 [Thalassospira profundimaris]MAL38494.1 peptidase S16 [Thalassospira sp.]MBO6770165.1 LON peptidase substrate-binding domain-containing protein [Thalassospira sp.]MCC4239692.1 LON peptidase substrate-binding domain-containing protein [Thalassospira povalilytica]PKR49770.1 peptidase S16 [Thalassospira povalilytica]|tara:strand:- start:2893 stop:3582 length:690 start_codon:yes stop_codon:yes gene_type:complete